MALPPVRPRVQPTLALASAACCLLLCVLWTANWWRAVTIGYVPRPGARWNVMAGFGTGLVGTLWETSRTVSDYDPIEFTATVGEADPLARRKDFLPHLREALIGVHVFRSSAMGIHETLVTIPAWPAILLTTIPPAIWWLRRRRRRTRGFPAEETADA